MKRNIWRRILVIVIFFLVSISVGLYAQNFLYERNVVSGVTTTIASMDGVQSAELLELPGGYTDILVTLHPQARLDMIYDRIETLAARELPRLNKVIVTDTRDERLETAYYDIHFAIQEAIAQGNFTQMADRIAAILDSDGLDVRRVVVTQHHVFVTLQADGAILHEVISRGPNVRGGETSI